jgi:hypothetical protein
MSRGSGTRIRCPGREDRAGVRMRDGGQRLGRGRQRGATATSPIEARRCGGAS